MKSLVGRCANVLAAVALLTSPLAVKTGSAQVAVSPTADVGNLHVEMAAGGAVEITYDLVGSDAKAVVSATLEAARSATAPFDIVPRTVRGDIGPGLRPGPGKRIVWDAAKDIEDVQPDRLRFRLEIRATPLTTAPDPDPRSVASRGIATVVTKPEDAMIGLDGRPLGLAPLEIRGISAGEHRITATKRGFASETRVIKVEAGVAARIEIPMSSIATSSARVERKSGKGKVLAIVGGAAAAVAVGVAAGGGKSPTATTAVSTPTTTVPTTTTTTTPTPNRAPTVSCGNVVFGGIRTLLATDVGIVSATRYQFSIAAASDVDGDSLSFTMTYGNGVTSTSAYSASNNSVTYVYPGAGTYSPSVTVRDARGGEAGCRYSTLLTSTVSGEWIGNATTGANSSRLVLSQSGVNVSGNYYEDGRTAANALQGTLTTTAAGRKDGTMTLSVAGNFNNQLTFVLEPADDLKSFKGTYSYRGRSGTFEMRKTQ